MTAPRGKSPVGAGCGAAGLPMLQPKAAAGRIARAVGGDRATEVELRPLAAATHDSDDEGDDWGLPALPVPRRHRSGPCPALDPRYSRAVAGGWLFGCAFTLVVLVLAATWVGPDPFSWEFALPEPTLSYSLSFERLRPIYHVMPVNGWQNDPNGPVFFGCAAPVRPACPRLAHAATPPPHPSMGFSG